MSHEVVDFQKQVIERSHDVPVVVDFWATWCGPCVSFGPVIEKAAKEADGAWELVKVDSDKHPDLSTQYGIRSLPTIKLFKNGVIVDEKLGAMPEPALKEWIQPHLESAEPADDRIDRVRDAIGEGDFETATSLLEEVLKDQPGNEDVKFMRIQAALAMEPASVAGLVKEFELGSAYHERAQYLNELAKLIIAGGEGEFQNGLDSLRKIQLPEAAAQWITVLEGDRNHDGAKTGLKNLFLYLGREHAVTQEFQPKFASILFS
ncbi:MAG: thioredoxin [Verrucomicrobiales bacterium]|nr:thioredoxin [Verrucomicrobiales bacterium]